jgi:tetratricopeptide (TPR) repeat protein
MMTKTELQRPPTRPSRQVGSTRERDWVALLPALAALVAFAPVVGNHWVKWDDYFNFLINPDFRGLGWPQIRWAWTTTHVGAYQPLSWMLFETEYAGWGLEPQGYHTVSWLLHAVVAALLYRVAVRLLAPGGVPPDQVRLGCALAVALWAAHPLQTEVVAWTSCQPYLPCALFSLLAVLAHLQAASATDGLARWTWCIGTWLLLTAALLFKAVALGVLPVLVLLDIYPLRRLGGEAGWFTASRRRVWAEKLVLVVLGVVFAIQAVRAKWDEKGQFLPKEEPVASRIDLAIYSAGFYVAKAVWPRDLIILYDAPERVGWPWPPFSATVLIVIGASLVAGLARRRYPALLAGWLAYLILLAPNSGLVHYTRLVAGDRYAYVPLMPLTILLAAGLSRALAPGQLPRPWGVGVTILTLALSGVLATMSWRQTLTWYDDEALWRHALAHGAAGSDVAQSSFGGVLANQGRLDEAIAHYTEAVRLNPNNFRARFNLGTNLAQRNRLDEAIDQFRAAVRLAPKSWEPHYNLGLALARQGHYAEAVAEFARAAELEPRAAPIHSNWGLALALQGRYAEAIPHYREALRLWPNYPEAQRHLAEALAQTAPASRPE